MLTHERLREVLNYDPETGAFTWKVRLSSRQAIGGEAGSLSPYGYLHIGIDGVTYRAHRLAWFYMKGSWPENEVDHEDRNRANNRWKNLRPATRKQNGENLSLRRDSTSGFRGVFWDAAKQRWQAHIKHARTRHFLGYRTTLIDAVALRIRAERDLFTHSAGAH